MQQGNEIALESNYETGENESIYQKSAPIPTLNISFTPKEI